MDNPSITEITIADLIWVLIKDYHKRQNNFTIAARPYVDAMRTMQLITDSYEGMSGVNIVKHFLANAGSIRGDVAREVKTELKRRLREQGQQIR